MISEREHFAVANDDFPPPVHRDVPTHLRETQKVLDEIDARRAELSASDLIALAQVRATLVLAIACDNLTDYSVPGGYRR